MNWQLDENRKLSNKDKVTVTYKYDNEAAKKFGIKFKGDKKEFKVSGLKEVKEVNPFDGIDVLFSGKSPNASASIEKTTNDSIYDDISYDLSKEDDIKKGEVITVTASVYDTDYFLEEYGCKLKETEKEYTCEAVDEYLSKLSDITEETLGSMKKQTEDVIGAYFANHMDAIAMEDLNYEGCYMLYTKAEDEWMWGGYNYVYVIYSANVKSVEEEKSFEKTKVYFPVRFTDIIRYADGTEYVDLNVDDIEGNTSLQFGWFGSVSGYTAKENMYSELIAAKKAEYVEDVSDTLR